ncbi:phasin family protein [Fodinicurvata fenggangensis]|uniref:phasin family protein n=1 Tax=Fodinicurvata fenggangensis TaxID=1121830 RepID=UPI00047CD4B7|nr:phasin family protein [Fodinicurvata fenggangensis]
MTSKKTASAQEALKPVEAAVNSGKETVDAVLKVSADAATKQYEQAFSMTKEQVEKSSNMAFKSYDEFQDLGKENLNAVVNSGTTFAKGFEAMSKEMMAFTQSNMEAGLAMTKKMLGAKNLQEFTDLHGEYSRGQFDKFLAESAKLGEMSMQTANEAVAPLQTRAQATMEKVMKPAA